MSPSANDLGTTHFCKFPGCEQEASSPVGRYSYCPEHQGKATSKRATASNGVVGKLAALRGLAVAADKAQARAEKLTRQALAAKDEADRARQRFAEALREASA